MTNTVRFFAITADDVERARKFYEAVFGWTFEDWGPPGFYLIHGAAMEGALQGRHEPIMGDHPRSFELTVGVDDLDDIKRRVLGWWRHRDGQEPYPDRRHADPVHRHGSQPHGRDEIRLNPRLSSAAPFDAAGGG
jgi:catechol 2,3-dioxygenase-like lactoylglutathione lyase family enzyme